MSTGRDASASGSVGREASASGSFDLQGEKGEKRRRLSGTFDASGATRALELILERKVHGSLVVSDGLVDLCFFFTRGGLRLVSAGRPLPSLPGRLVAQGRISREDAAKVQAAVKKREAAEQRLEDREALIEVLALQPAEVDAAIREIVSDALLGSLFWEEPQFEVATGEPNMDIVQRKDLSALTLSLGLPSLVTEIIQRIKTIAETSATVASLQVSVELLPKGREAHQAGGKLGEGPLAERRTKVLQRIAKEPGSRAVDLAKRLDMGDLEMANHLRELVVGGLARLERKAPTKEEERARLRAMEDGVELALSQLVRRMKLAQDCGKAGDQVRAGMHLARAGTILLAERRDEDALRTFTGAVELAPANLEGREGYVQSLWATNKPAEAAAQSEELGQRYLDSNLPGRAKRVLERAIAREERSTSLDLLVKAFVKLRQPKAAAEAGERLVNRLRREGRSAQARAVASSLLAIATEADRQRLIRAAGADRGKVAVMLAVTAVLGAGLLPASEAYASREGYRHVLGEARDSLDLAQDLPRAESALASIEDRLRPAATQGGVIGDHAKLVLDDLAKLRADVRRARVAGADRPWWRPEVTDLEEVLHKLEGLQPAGPALEAPLKRALLAIEQFKGTGSELRLRLMQTEPGDDAMALARQLRQEYHALPGLLAQAEVPIRIDTRPPGATVRWGGSVRSKTTPIDLTLPMMSPCELVLTRDGFEPSTSTIDFDSLGGRSTVVIELKPRAATPTPPPRPRPPTPTPPVETPPVDAPPAGVTATPRPADPKPARDPSLQVEFRDGGWLTDEPDPRFRFEPAPKVFADLTLDARFQCVIEALNVVEGTSVSLAGLRVFIQVRGAGGVWRDEAPVSMELPRKRRPMRSEGPNVFRVDAINRTLHLDSPTWLREQAQEALDDAVRTVRTRERDRSRGAR